LRFMSFASHPPPLHYGRKRKPIPIKATYIAETVKICDNLRFP
jgi:hypothetical protein